MILHRHTAVIRLTDPQPAGDGEVSVAVAYLRPIQLMVSERYTVGMLIWAGWQAEPTGGAGK